MKITRSGTIPSMPGPDDWFTGTVRIDPRYQTEAPGTAAGTHVTFQPGARTAWPTHPAGQTLIVTCGRGRVQRAGWPVEEIAAGDVVSFAPNEKRWHGAGAETAMSHIVIQEAVDGVAVTWTEKVADEDHDG